MDKSFLSQRYLFFYPSVLFSVFGVFMVTASSGPLSLGRINIYALKQSLYLVLGLMVYKVGVFVGEKHFFFNRKILWIICIFLLLLPLTFLGKTINGASRWVTLIPGINLQLSEFVKVLWVMILATFSYQHHFALQKRWVETGLFCLSLCIILLLLLKQPDFGSVAVLAAVTAITLFVAKVRLDFMLVLLSALAIAVCYLVTHASYRLVRFLAFLNPEAYAQTQAYQLWQSLIGISSGGFWGQGIGQSWQKFGALPECHTDFIFAIFLEETGFIGGLFFLFFFFLFIFTLFKMAAVFAQEKKYLATYFYIGAGSLFLVQLSVNLGVCLGLLPTKGLTLPFISYGGSSLWAFLALMGLLDGVKNRE